MTGVYASLGKSITQAQQLWVEADQRRGRHLRPAARADRPRPRLRPAEGRRRLHRAGARGAGLRPVHRLARSSPRSRTASTARTRAWSSRRPGRPRLLGSPYIRTVGATYDIEMINAVDFLLDQKRIATGDKIGHVYFEGDYGENALAGSKYAAKEAGLTVVEQKIKPTDNDMSAQVAALKQAGRQGRGDQRRARAGGLAGRRRGGRRLERPGRRQQLGLRPPAARHPGGRGPAEGLLRGRVHPAHRRTRRRPDGPRRGLQGRVPGRRASTTAWWPGTRPPRSTGRR